MPVQHSIDDERELWDTYARSEKVREQAVSGPPAFRWTQYEGHGPGVELLGDPGTALEIGCGTARMAGYLSERGVKVSGVDLSPVMVEQVSRRWPGVRFFAAEVLEHLSQNEDTYDAVYSMFGAVWFTDPEKLFPLVLQRLSPGGVLAFSQPPAIPGAYGPQGMYKGGFAGRAMYTYRYSFEPETWGDLLLGAGFGTVRTEVVDAPVEGHIGTLIVTARKPSRQTA
ncbi:class I SAM-dependent DNA methyltransferase [Streptomyces daliensis]|uniref:Class I SAM-dependent methyltransferase n=1 Tax=Streptomyces daliensis TaxID=299421 RepID=A0A8T4ISY9_9ACTN|nr:class I SAM-dependent methyltransferase [Streptomyces daliensis]